MYLLGNLSSNNAQLKLVILVKIIRGLVSNTRMKPNAVVIQLNIFDGSFFCFIEIHMSY